MDRTSRRTFLRTFVTADRPDVAARETATLVVVFLRGGADTLNMVVPVGDDGYYRARPSIAIRPPANAADAAIRLDDFYALHPRMQPLVPAWSEGRLAIVQGVGSDNPTGSHFEAQDQMEHGEAFGSPVGGGWIGRMLRARGGVSAGPLAAVAIGTAIPESLRGARSTCAMVSIDEIRMRVPPERAVSVTASLGALYGEEEGPLGAPGRETLELLERVEALQTAPYRAADGAEYAEDGFSGGLREVARLVKGGVGLEVACLDLGGWDTHFVQGTADGLQAGAIDRLARGLAGFDADLGEDRNRVTTLVMTEFGRRITENSSAGTDHGRGFAMLAMGGNIEGGRVYGAWPGLDEDVYAFGPGGLPVLVDYRSVLSEVLEATRRGDAGRGLAARVFPGFTPGPVGLVGARRLAG